MTNKEILKALTNLANPDYAEKLKQQLPADTAHQIIGVPVTALTEIARELACRNDWASIVKQLPDDYFETILLQAFVFLIAENDKKKQFDWIRHFLDKIDCTALCDNTCLAFGASRTWPDDTLRFIKECISSKNEMIVRFAIVMLLDHFTTSDYADTTLELYNQIDTSLSPMCLKALAWGYSVCFMSFPKRTIEALEKRMPKEETNLIIQEMLTQPRITNAAREAICGLISNNNENS